MIPRGSPRAPTAWRPAWPLPSGIRGGRDPRPDSPSTGGQGRQRSTVTRGAMAGTTRSADDLGERPVRCWPGRRRYVGIPDGWCGAIRSDLTSCGALGARLVEGHRWRKNMLNGLV